MQQTPPLLIVLLAVLALAGCGPSYAEQAAEARADGDYTLAAEMYTRAAVESACPARAQFLMARAEVQELDGVGASAMESIEKAIRNCPDLVDPYWMRAQRAAEAGDRDLAMADAQLIQEVHPEAAALYAELAMQAEVERSVRSRVRELVLDLSEHLDLEAADVQLRGHDREDLAPGVPVPVTTTYQVKQSVDSPKRFSLQWEEMWSYRGESAADGYVLVRRLDVPPIDRDLPLYYRLSMSNQRQAMRFNVDAEGNVTGSSWLRNGPDRGMRPEMLRPEVQGMLRRRLAFDPGDRGRGPGDTWRGEDIRVVDGKPVEVAFESRAVAWEQVFGIRTLRVKSTLTGAGYSCEEDVWLHPATAIPIRWVRNAKYAIETPSGDDVWADETQGALVSVSGVD